MLDFSGRGRTALHVNAAVDAALVARQAATEPRAPSAGFRLGQRMADRAARVLRACDAGDLPPRIVAGADFHERRFCRRGKRRWSLPA